MTRALLIALACAGCYDFNSLRAQSSLCAGFGGVMCDGFEDRLTAPPGWGNTTGATSGSLTVDSQRVYRGAYALHIHADATNGTATAPADVGGRVGSLRGVFDTAAAQAVQSRVYLRMFLFEPALVEGRVVPINIARGATANVSAATADVFIDGGGFILADQTAQTTPGPLAPVNRWACIEFGWDNTVGTGQLWVDGSSVLTLSGPTLKKDSLDPQSLNVDYVQLGYSNSRSGRAMPAFDAWIDEIAVDVRPIGCAR
jgi:hypothetical protein